MGPCSGPLLDSGGVLVSRLRVHMKGPRYGWTVQVTPMMSRVVRPVLGSY